MQQNQNNSGETTQDRNLDPYNALQKVIRIDKKHTNFQYRDQERNVNFRVSYPTPSFQAPNNQHLLKGFWRHINNYYFKQIQQSQLERLNYLESLMQPSNKCHVRFSGTPEFWYTVERIFSEEYFNRYQKSEVENLDCKNWLESMFLIWEKSKLKDKNKNKISTEIRQIEHNFKRLTNFNKQSTKQRQKLQTQSSKLGQLLPNQAQDDYVSLQIAQYQSKLQQQCSQNRKLLTDLKTRIHLQLDKQQLSIIKYHKMQQEEIQSEQEIQIKEAKIYKQKRKLKLMKDGDQIKKYLKYCIMGLEKKQIAQSISKISKLEKGKSNQENKFQIQFQTGMNLNPLLMSQKQMLQLNKLREYNLFKFYNTSLKSHYSFICQNYFGFRWIFQNPTKQCTLKDKNIHEEMLKAKNQAKQSQASKKFSTFDICHHCKLLYPNDFLVPCKYNSSVNGAPITPSSYYDPYVSQIVKLEQPKLSNRFVGRKKNCYLGYTKKNEQYCCDRKFCKYCMKQNYQQGHDKNGLCPFCQGICFCTRCARNDMIVRLKSMFLLLGGDIHLLENQSYIDQIMNWDRQVETKQNARIVSRSKSRPTKKPIGGNPIKMNQKMRNIRYQLQELRILCDLVKRRQKQKQKLAQIRCDIFKDKMAMINKGRINLKQYNSEQIRPLIKQQEQIQRKKQKMSKKLKRMI